MRHTLAIVRFWHHHHPHHPHHPHYASSASSAGCGNGILPHVANGGCERDAGSYRIPAAQALEQWNITVETVGSLTAGPASSPLGWQHHEGHPGWTAVQVEAISPAWTKLEPDMITVLLGTNDW